MFLNRNKYSSNKSARQHTVSNNGGQISKVLEKTVAQHKTNMDLTVAQGKEDDDEEGNENHAAVTAMHDAGETPTYAYPPLTPSYNLASNPSQEAPAPRTPPMYLPRRSPRRRLRTRARGSRRLSRATPRWAPPAGVVVRQQLELEHPTLSSPNSKAMPSSPTNRSSSSNSSTNSSPPTPSRNKHRLSSSSHSRGRLRTRQHNRKPPPPVP
nr:serine/arginine repetitive matrix protein 1-like [Penaeus vannamei]